MAVSGFNLAATPEHLLLKLFEQYVSTGHPKHLFLICEALPAVPERALDLISKELCGRRDGEFLRGIQIPFLGFSPWTQRLVRENLLEAYSWPLGIVAYWFREVASGRPGLITKIGIDTVLDPGSGGGALNKRAQAAMSCKISAIRIGHERHPLYQAPKPDCSLIRASVADESGNLSMADEGIRGTVLNIAQATKARPNPGRVIAQVRWITRDGTLNPREVDVPSPLVDQVVLSPRRHHWQAGTFEYDPRISYRVTQPLADELLVDVTSKGGHEFEKVIARRVLLELIRVLEAKKAPVLVNLGVGIPAMVSRVAVEEGVSEHVVTVLESGLWGGMALTGRDFGLALSPFAISSIPDMFSNFEGGVIDAASLGFLQIDAHGDVNPSLLPDAFYGPGGFPVIAGGAPRTFFAGSFTAGPSRIAAGPRGITISKDGPIEKFVEKVDAAFFSAKEAIRYGKDILYITERAVFRLTRRGLVMEEIAPGVDLERDVLGRMRFEPAVSRKLKPMDEILFTENRMGVRTIVERSMGDRV